MKRFFETASAATIVLCLTGGSASAQNANADQAGQPAAAQTGAGASSPEEIVVTAQKRSERLMSVPISITALSATALNDTGAKNLIELQGVAPGVYFSGNPGYSVTPIAIRGTSGTGNFLGDEPVTIYVDGVFQNAGSFATGDFTDVASLEIVRGPQGTLQGRNSTAGAVLISTQDPEQTFGGYLRASVAEPLESRVQAAVTGPLTKTLSGRLALGVIDERGWAHNTFYNIRAGGHDSAEARGVLLWQPNQAAEVRLSAGYSDASTSVAIARWAQTTVNPTGQAVILGVNATPRTPLTPAQQSAILDDYNIPLNTIPRSDMDTAYAALNASYDFGGVELVSITGLNGFALRGQSDSDGLSLTDRYGFNRNREVLQVATEEMRLQSTGQQRFSWILGGYLSRIEGSQDIKLYNLTFSTGRNQYLRSIAHQTDSSWAAFADTTLHFTDTLSLTTGVRYTEETKDFHRTSGFYNPADDSLYPAPPFSTYTPPQAKFDHLSYRAILNFTPSPDQLYYVSYSEGFKSGGFNALGNDPVFQPETLVSTEIGAKWELFDRRLQLTSAVYHNDYENLQVTAGVPAGGVAIYNAAQAKIDGAEVEGRFRITDHFDLVANAAYTNARFTSFPRAQAILGNIVNASGNKLPRAPRWQYFIQPTYTMDLPNGWNAEAQLSWRWRDKVYFFFTDQDASNLQGDPDGELGARVSLHHEQTGLTLAVFGTNLNNERVVNNEQSLFNYPVATFNKPRTVGVEINKEF